MKNFDEITVIWTVEESTPFLVDKIRSNQEDFSNIILVCPDSFMFDDEQLSPIVTYETDEGLVSGLNKALDLVETPWVLHLNNREQPDVKSIRAITLNENKVYAGLIESYDPYPVKKQHYQIRLFRKSENIRFSGFDIPYITAGSLPKTWEISDEKFTVSTIGSSDRSARLEIELEYHANAGYPGLLKAIQYSAAGDHKRAIPHFREALKTNKLISFDYMAALNGLANALAETNRWEESRNLLERSLELTVTQKMPYLVLYKIAQYSKNWEKACEHLGDYFLHSNDLSHTNFDVTLPEVDFHFLMADAAFRSGNYQKAFRHYEEYYELNDGKIGDDILERMFIYSVELSDYGKSKRYFMDLFERYLPDRFDEKISILMNEALSLFVEKGWVDFACRIYEKLYKKNPNDEVILHRWVAALIKAKKIEKAQLLLSNRKKRQMAMVGK